MAAGEEQVEQPGFWRAALPSFRLPLAIVCREDGVDGIPLGLIDDRLVLTGIAFLLVDDVAEIDAVVQQFVEHLFAEFRPRARGLSIRSQLLDEISSRAATHEFVEDTSACSSSAIRCGPKGSTRVGAACVTSCPCSSG